MGSEVTIVTQRLNRRAATVAVLQHMTIVAAVGGKEGHAAFKKRIKELNGGQ